MANILHVERTDNKITLGATGTTINIASHTASLLLGLDASKNLESVSDLTTWIAGTANQITVTDDTDGTVTLSLPTDVIISGASTPSITIKATDASDPKLCLQTVLNAHEVCFQLDESVADDHVDFKGQTADVNTRFHVIAQTGYASYMGVQQGSYRGELICGAGGHLTLQNTAEDMDIVLKIDDGGVTKTIKWDADVDKLIHSAGTFNFDSGHLTTTGDLTAGNYTAAALLTACATNAGELDFTAASKKLDVEDNAVVSQDYSSDANVQFAIVSVDNYGLHVLDTNASHDLTFGCGSDLTADRAITFSPGNANRTITLSGNPTLADWFDQDVRTSASPAFVDLNVTGVYKVDGTQVVKEQQVHIADATTQDLAGTDSVDETKLESDLTGIVSTINSILSTLEAHGLVASA